MATRGLDSQIWGGGGKIEVRHILDIALSEHHVDYMNRKEWSLRYYIGGGGGAFSLMCTLDSMDSWIAPGFWQTLISTVDVWKRYCSEIEAHRPEIPVVLRGNPA